MNGALRGSKNVYAATFAAASAFSFLFYSPGQSQESLSESRLVMNHAEGGVISPANLSRVQMKEFSGRAAPTSKVKAGLGEKPVMPAGCPEVDPELTNPSKPIKLMKLQDVTRMVEEDERIVVTFMGGVYDVTDFTGHPGGYGRLEMVAGMDLEPFWKVRPTALLPSFHSSLTSVVFLSDHLCHLRRSTLSTIEATFCSTCSGTK